jgi:hypothetical protein
VGRIRIGKRKEWQALPGDRKQVTDAGNETEIHVVPPVHEFLVGELDLERLAQSGEVDRCRNLTALVSLIGFVERESVFESCGIAACSQGRQLECFPEVEGDNDTAEIEQQGMD